MPRDVMTLRIWNGAAAGSEARLLMMQAGLRRAGDLLVQRLATNTGTSPNPPRVVLTAPCGTTV